MVERHRAAFYQEVRKVANFFLGFGLCNALRVPLVQYLVRKLAFAQVQRGAIVFHFVVGNVVLLATRLRWQVDTLALVTERCLLSTRR